ncbi:putative glutathione-specific gamma-glutamylcyclotransferase 2 [Ctenocephalides felis]|uniref:putative glutathione-specific gamma-glutamylcyclotransferase 2 n=1 Tax=Ctenocephalides felis TaxID=7515 RepID=UPI000E6E291E|nr:putative glutathione-specific gamma-glutamylcyclotransferase 2 [Ctenocephalides felis]XP_026463506.1 putative glutathione-specific gamma-glutamylcyclotransferase 2 [Ctenocephalides felis]
MWVFGYGSLVWKVDFPYEKKLTGYIKGYNRRFYQHSIDHRGIPQKPGRVVTLLLSKNSNDKVWGVAYKIKDCDVEKVTKHLDHREKNGYIRSTVKFYPKENSQDNSKPFELYIYVATPENESFAGEASIEDIAQQIFTAYGPSGSNKEYIYNLANAMRDIGPEAYDEHLCALEKAVRRLEYGA